MCQVCEKVPDRECISLMVLRGLRWLRVKSKLYVKCRRRSRPCRKRRWR